jgi:hypothetical protein
VTVVFSSKLADGRIYIASDAAVGYEDGYRQLMEEGKWWTYDGFYVGESGDDFALSRIRARFETKNKAPSPDTLAECVREVASEMTKDHTECLSAQLLYADAHDLAVVGGDGGILRRKHDACVGHGATVLTSYLVGRLPAPSKRTFKNVSIIVREGLVWTARLCDSVCDPFFEDVQ